MQSRVPAAIVLSAVIVGLGGVDFWIKEKPRLMEQMQAQGEDQSSDASSASSQPSIEPGPDTLPQSSSSARRAVKKGQSTKKRQAQSVDTIYAALGLSPVDTHEVSLLQVTSPPNVKVTTSVLLQNGDRALLFAWLDDGDAKGIFATLKESLQSTFSPQVHDLVDQTLTPDDGAVTDVLSFIDPSMSTEQIIFVRTRTRVYEIHVASGKGDLATKLIAELSK